jgi:arylsulfatase
MKQPNIVLIMTDQQRFDTIKAAGYPYMTTPNIDRLADDGVMFTKAFCPGATCISSRAAIFTGMYPHNTGVYSFNNWAHHHNIAKVLNHSGYHCVNLGKIHMMPLYDPAGFHERRVVENKSMEYKKSGLQEDEWSNFLSWHGINRPTKRHEIYEDWKRYKNAVSWEYDDDLHSDNFIGDISTEWLNTYELDKPLFLQIGFAGPHEPYDPPAKYLDYYSDNELPLPVFKDSEFSEKPPQQETLKNYFRDAYAESQIDVEDASEAELLRMRKHYYANITLIDEKVGQIVNALDKKGMLSNTVLIFTSDHGDNLGDHRLAYKWLMYDTVVNVPLVIRDFRKETGNEPRRNNDLVNLIDLAPTILEYARVKLPDYLEGQSLLPIMENQFDPAMREYVFCEDNYLIMIRSKTHKLVYYIGQEYGEFYDLIHDPNELDNLFDDPSVKDQIQSYESALLRWLSKSNYFNGQYKTDRAENYSTRWPEDESFGTYLQGCKRINE